MIPQRAMAAPGSRVAVAQCPDYGKSLLPTMSRMFDQLGGLAGAIRSHATTVEDKIVEFLGNENREIFSKLFAHLVVVTIDRTPTRRWASKEKFDATLKAVIDIDAGRNGGPCQRAAFLRTSSLRNFSGGERNGGVSVPRAVACLPPFITIPQFHCIALHLPI